MKFFGQKKNHGYEPQSKLRDVIPSTVRDCSTYNTVPHCFACGIIPLALRSGSQRVSLKFESHNRQAGFTLIELMVVIVILGVLAGLIIPRIMGRPDEARQAKAKIQMEALESALKLYKLDNGGYPTTEQGLKALVEAPTVGNIPKNWRQGGYLEKGRVPKDPWGNEFVYISPGSHGDFDLSSLGADGEPGGEGKNKDINNWEIE
jgi:general secretion pathway protein G